LAHERRRRRLTEEQADRRLVVDLPMAFYVTAVQVPNSKILGQFPTVGTQEHFGMVFERGNTLVRCIIQSRRL
jgi:polar amino acid transport system substrate-binding protein